MDFSVKFTSMKLYSFICISLYQYQRSKNYTCKYYMVLNLYIFFYSHNLELYFILIKHLSFKINLSLQYIVRYIGINIVNAIRRAHL